MVTAIDIENEYISVGRAHKARGKLTVLEHHSCECTEPLKTAKDLISKVGTDAEDIVVVNYPSDLLLFNTVNVPATVKGRELTNYLAMEISHLLSVPIEDLVVEGLEGPSSKAVAIVAKKREVNSLVTRLMEAGLPEPDVVLPDIFKYLQLVNVTIHSTIAVAIFATHYSAVCVYVSGKLAGLRSVPYSTQEILGILTEETGFTKTELQVNSKVIELEKLTRMVESLIPDMPYTVERELIFLLSSIQSGVSVRDVSGLYVLCDPLILTGAFIKTLELNETFQGKVSKIPLSFEVEGVPLGLLGMLLRGGAEFGKNKFVQVQKANT